MISSFRIWISNWAAKKATNPLLILSYVFPFVCRLKWGSVFFLQILTFHPHTLTFLGLLLKLECIWVDYVYVCIIARRLPNITRLISTHQCKSDTEDAGGRNCIKDERRQKTDREGNWTGEKRCTSVAYLQRPCSPLPQCFTLIHSLGVRLNNRLSLWCF